MKPCEICGKPALNDTRCLLCEVKLRRFNYGTLLIWDETPLEDLRWLTGHCPDCGETCLLVHDAERHAMPYSYKCTCVSIRTFPWIPVPTGTLAIFDKEEAL